MMVAKPKPKSDPSEGGQSLLEPEISSSFSKILDTDDREKELERRLAMLGGGGDAVSEINTSTEPVVETTAPRAEEDLINTATEPTLVEEEVVEEEKETPSSVPEPVVEETLIPSFEEQTAPTPTPTPILQESPAPEPIIAEPILVTSKPNTAPTKKRDALLARIMAAQERARQQKSSETTNSVQTEKEKMMKALNGDKTEKEEEQIKPPPPPPFEIVEQQQLQQEVMPPPPPFEAVEHDILQQFNASAPSAPPVEELAPAHPITQPVDFLSDLPPIIAPPVTTNAVAPPSFDQFMQTQQEAPPSTIPEEEVFDFDIDGNSLSPEERRKMMEEQRAILEQIQKESSQNAASEAAARAAEFEMRSNTAAAAAVEDVPMARPRNATTSSLVTDEARAANGEHTEGESEATRTVQIGGGQQVALHGQDKTRAAIADGTAILVQCVNCQNWMQVTESATLMFCPVCSVVSPVMKQTEVMTKEEAVQMTLDRKLAEQLQSMEYDEEERSGAAATEDEKSSYVPEFIRSIDKKLRGTEESESMSLASSYPAARRGTASSSASTKSKSWWDTFSSAVSVGVTNEEANARSAEITISRPPGQRTLHSVNTGTSEDEEHAGLLSSTSSPGRSGNVNRLPPARVAERQPLFSCIVDSIATTANTVGTALTTRTVREDEDGELHGVDTSSLLTVTNAGRKDGGGNYHVISDNDN